LTLPTAVFAQYGAPNPASVAPPAPPVPRAVVSEPWMAQPAPAGQPWQ
jgi:hypothetical protein